MRSKERGRKEGKKELQEDWVTVAELIPQPPWLKHAPTNIWPHTKRVMWHFGRGGGGRTQSGRVFQGEGKQKFQWLYQLTLLILVFHSFFIKFVFLQQSGGREKKAAEEWKCEINSDDKIKKN